MNSFVSASDRDFKKAAVFDKKAEKLREGVERSAGKFDPKPKKSKAILKAHLKKDQPKVWKDFAGKE